MTLLSCRGWAGTGRFHTPCRQREPGAVCSPLEAGEGMACAGQTSLLAAGSPKHLSLALRARSPRRAAPFPAGARDLAVGAQVKMPGGRGRGAERERASGFCSHHLPLGPLGQCSLGGQMLAEETGQRASLCRLRTGAGPPPAALCRSIAPTLWLKGRFCG